VRLSVSEITQEVVGGTNWLDLEHFYQWGGGVD